MLPIFTKNDVGLIYAREIVEADLTKTDWVVSRYGDTVVAQMNYCLGEEVVANIREVWNQHNIWSEFRISDTTKSVYDRRIQISRVVSTKGNYKPGNKAAAIEAKFVAAEKNVRDELRVCGVTRISEALAKLNADIQKTVGYKRESLIREIVARYTESNSPFQSLPIAYSSVTDENVECSKINEELKNLWAKEKELESQRKKIYYELLRVGVADWNVEIRDAVLAKIDEIEKPKENK